MNDRRDFLKKSIFLTAGMAVAKSATAFASPGGFPSGVVYTKDNPGKWAKKVGSHAPEVKVEGKKVTLTTKHPMSEKHYIVRHTLVSADGTVLGSKTFYPSDKKRFLPMNFRPTMDPSFMPPVSAISMISG